jgi:hypothetical protein
MYFPNLLVKEVLSQESHTALRDLCIGLAVAATETATARHPGFEAPDAVATFDQILSNRRHFVMPVDVLQASSTLDLVLLHK